MEGRIQSIIDNHDKLIRSAGEFDAYENLKQLLRNRRLIAASILKCNDEDNLLILEGAYEMYNQQIKNLLAL